MKKNYLLFVALFIISGGRAQSVHDILVKAFQSEDSSAVYFAKAKKMIKTPADDAEYYFCKGAWHTDLGIADSAVYYSNIAASKLSALKDYGKLVYVYNNLGKVYTKQGAYDKCVEVFQKGLTVAEAIPNQKFIANFLHNIANAHHNFEDYKKGVAYGKRNLAVVLAQKNRDPFDVAGALNVIAINYDDWGKADSALYYHRKVFDYIRGKDTLELTSTYNNIGNTLLKKKKYSDAKRWIETALKLTLRDPKSESYQYDLATNYTNLATIAYNTDDFAAAEKYFALAKKAVDKSRNAEKRRDLLYHQSAFYRKKNDLAKALEFQEAYISQRDSVFAIERAKAFADLETKYQTEKKEKLLLRSKAELAAQQAEVRRKNNYFIILSLISLALVVITWLIYRQQRLKNVQLAQEHELKTAIAQIETQNKLQEQRLGISRDLHDNIGAQLTFIISSVDSVRYAFDLANTKLDNKLRGISTFAQETIMELRDTIWAMNNNEITIEELRTRILNFIEKAKEARENANFSFHVDDSIAGVQLSSIEGMNIHRTIQEAVNNALKYAHASEITIRISRIVKGISISINDNGQGFDLVTTELGNGIRNMRKRMADIGAEFLLESTPGSGTSIKIKFNKGS